MTNTYLKTAWRNIRYQKGTSIINIAGLAIGMWAAVLIFIWVQNELSFDSNHKNAKDIFLIKNYIGADKQDASVWENSPYLLGEKAQEQVPDIIKVARIQPVKFPVPYVNRNGNFIKEENCAYVDSSWFSMFDHKLLSGSMNAFNNNPFSVLLTASKAKKYFGSEDPLGKTLRIDTIDYKVQGVLANNPANTSFNFDVFLPLAAKMSNAEVKKDIFYWGNYSYLTFIKLLPSADPSAVEKKLTAILLKERERESMDLKAGLVNLPAMHFDKSIQDPDLLRGDRKTVGIFSVLGILLVLIASINYVNLTTARATLRMKEVSMRKIAGAGRIQLFVQFVTESFLISFIALVIAVIGVSISLPMFNEFSEKTFSFSGMVWMIAGAMLFLSVVLCSIYPALLLSSFRPITFFKGSNVFGLKSVSLRKGLVVTQFTLSIILIISSIVVYRQMQFISRQSTIADKSQIFSFKLPFSIYKKYKKEAERVGFMEMYKQQLTAQSSVATVTRLNGGSLINMQSWSSGDGTDWDGRESGFEPKISFFESDGGLKDLLNLRLTHGRWFIEGTADKMNSILNETAVRELNIHQPVIGQRFVARGDTGIIVGVVKDFYYKKLNEKIGPVVIRNTPEMSSTYFVKTVPGRTMEAKNAAEKTWKSFFPSEPFPYTFLNDEYEALYRSEQRILLLVGVFSVLAILISCLGLFGLAAFTAERRRKEIGIRKVVGASVTDIVTIISREFVLLISIAFLIATPLAWWAMNNWLRDFAYRTNFAWWIFLVAGLVTVIIALTTMSYHAIRAAVQNPVKSLRTE